MPKKDEQESFSFKALFVDSIARLGSYVYEPNSNLPKMLAVHALGAAEVAINTLTPIVLLQYFKFEPNSGSSDHSAKNKSNIILIGSFALVASSVLPRIRSALMASVKRDTQREISMDMVRRVYDGPLDEHIGEPTGDLVATISKNYAETEKVMPLMVDLSNTILETAARSAILFRYFGGVGLTPGAVFFPYFLAAFGGEVYGALLKLNTQKDMVGAFDQLLETVNNYTVAMQNGSSERELNKLELKVKALEKAFSEVSKAEESTALIVTMINRMGFLAAAAYVYANPAAAGVETSKEAILMAYYFLTSAIKFESLPPKFNALLNGIAGTFLVDKFLRTHPVLQGPDDPVLLDLRGAPEIEFRGVSFSYGDEERGLTDISFVASAGSTVVIMGPTGCGKSTLFKLLQRFHHDYTGEILVNGINIANIEDKNLRRYISAVSQDTGLVNDTLLENVRYSDPSVDEDTAIQAARYASLDLERDRFFSMVEKRGENFSGGEKQRTLIARALVKGGAGYILLGDEVTSALDQKTSIKIHEMLDQLGDVTKIIVTHDPQLVRNADQIVCMGGQGKIAQKGTFDELIQDKAGEFYKLFSTSCRELGVPMESLTAHAPRKEGESEFTGWLNSRRHSYFTSRSATLVEDEAERFDETSPLPL